MRIERGFTVDAEPLVDLVQFDGAPRLANLRKNGGTGPVFDGAAETGGWVHLALLRVPYVDNPTP